MILKDSSKSDRIIMTAALLCMLICGYLVFDDRWLQESIFAKTPQIGKIQYRENDTRLRTSDSLVWYKAHDAQNVHLGDSVFFGDKSIVQIELKKGGDITVGENSMVVFREFESQKLADLNGGNFRLKVEGELKIAIGGEVTTLKGHNSEVQVFMGKDKKPQLKLLRGKAQVRVKNKKPVELTEQAVVMEPEPQAPKPASVVAAPLPEIPSPESKLQEVSYNFRLYDIFEKRELDLVEKTALPEVVDTEAKLEWSTLVKAGRAFVEVSKNSDFSKSSRLESKTGNVTVSPLFLGENYWRVSFDEKNWSEPQKIITRGGFLKDQAPALTENAVSIPLTSTQSSYAIRLKAPLPVLGFVAQASTESRFPKEQTHTFWNPSEALKVAFYHPGKYFYRFRSVNKNQELSEWSDTMAFDIFAPELPQAPQLVKAKKSGFLDEEFTASFKAKSPQVEIEIANDQGEIVSQMNGKKVAWRPSSTGSYQMRAFARNEYGQRGPSSKVVKIEVLPRPVPVLAEKKILKRKPSSVEATTVVKMEQAPSLPMNEKYKSSLVSLEGFLWTIQSSRQYYENEPAPTASGVGIRGVHWWDHSGVEGTFKAGVVGLNQTGNQTSLKDLEARYHFRFFTPAPFGLTRELQISLFAGYEIYENAGGLLSSQYELMKFGTSLEFPLGSRLGAGGEIVGGYGFDGSQKQEVSGHFDYFFKKDWSLGLGYRVHLFQAGSASSAPSGSLPYREGYTEGYSLLNYHF